MSTDTRSLRRIAAELDQLRTWCEEVDQDGAEAAVELLRRHRIELRAIAARLDGDEPAASDPPPPSEP